MKGIGIIPNQFKDHNLTVTKQIVRWINQKGMTVYTTEEIERELGEEVQSLGEQALYESCECVIAIGGDGTILGVAEKACTKDVPIIGINLGRVGFLTDIEPQEIEKALEKLLQGDYEIEERMMLQATVISPAGEEQVFHALNDINVTRGSLSRIAEFELHVNGDLCDIYPADGVIVSTPTGSTAYNLSAGGPIVVPHVNAYIITPICPHTIYSKSIILSEKDHMAVRVLEDDKDTALSIDGKLKMYLTPYHTVRIEKSAYVTKLIKLFERKFFNVLTEKILERRR